MSLFLISSFAARPRFSGTFNNDNWQKFNLFSILYIVLVYIPFVSDFYLYFMSYGLRRFASFVAIEAVVIMTIIVLILLLEIIQQCTCAGMSELDLAKRARLSEEAKKGGKKSKRRALRSGMGIDEDYDDEYGSEDFGDIAEEDEEESEDEEEVEVEEEEEDSQGNVRVVKKKKNQGLAMLEDLAKQMKQEKDKLNKEKNKIL